MFTFFANLRIQSQDRLERLQVCLDLLARVKTEGWVFNIRGEFKSQAAQLIQNMGLQPLTITYIEGEEGWSADTLKLLDAIKSEFTVFVVEDHFLVCNPLVLENSIAEMKQFGVDILDYSWHWPTKPYDCIKGIPYFEGNYITGFDLDLKSNIRRHQNYEAALGYKGSVYSISMISIFRTSLLVRVCQNYQLDRRRFGPMTPFDTERSGCDIDFFPLRTAYSKIEMYAALDDENIIPGCALQQRGLYKNLSNREVIQQLDGNHPWLYHDVNFIVPKELSNEAETQVLIRTYKYIDFHREFVANFSSIVGAHLIIFSEVFRLNPDINSLIDYESLSGLASVLFHKVYRKHISTYRSHDDRQAVRAHENIFLNKVFSGYKCTYLHRQVTFSEHLMDGVFSIYADYSENGLPKIRPTPARIAYLDVMQADDTGLLENFSIELDDKNLNAVILYTDLTTEKTETSLYSTCIHNLIRAGFGLHTNYDFTVHATPDSQETLSAQRRCAIFRR
jgi:hypothetical protein